VTSDAAARGTPPDLAALETLLRERLGGTLPGIEAQRRFMPTPPRTGWKPGEFPAAARTAAGLLLLYPGPRGISIPLTVRASGLRRHPGQISLPGGATDPGETLAEAALREAHEEIGLDSLRVRVLGELTPVHVLVSGFTLHPVVAVSGERPSFVPAAHEVQEIIEVSVSDLQDASNIRQGTRTREGLAIEYPYFDIRGHQVWGATAMVLGEFLSMIAALPSGPD
jgi:8-oxo-dGTP pyrophosphatase MutT (NUDIX family)